jgi:murein DD-endopeptidase MepM/ murein hydrolase activator NlpD
LTPRFITSSHHTTHYLVINSAALRKQIETGVSALTAYALGFARNPGVRRAGVAVAVLLALPVFGVLTAFGVASDTQTTNLARVEVVTPLTLPNFDASADDAALFRQADRIQRGDSVAAVLQRLNVNDTAAFEFLRTSKDARSIFQLRPGRTVQAVTDSEGELQSLVYLHSADRKLEVKRTGESFAAEERTIAPAIQLTYKGGVIRSSLYGATDTVGIPDAVANQIARIFSTDIDFHTDLRTGDRFNVTYEMLYEKDSGEYLRPGRVVSAEFTNKGKTFQAFLFTDSDGIDGYYGADGSNRAKSFLRSPLAFSRVSSSFGGRIHPIFRQWRAHTGVDFAAPRGTPTWATADGTVEFAGVKGGYGNVVEIRHSGSISTLYAHLSGFGPGVRKGVRVSQGQTIGYVGSTGFATGPHLHYEFKIGGQHQDPMRVALPKAEPLAAKYLGQFNASTRTKIDQLARLRDSPATSVRFE